MKVSILVFFSLFASLASAATEIDFKLASSQVLLMNTASKSCMNVYSERNGSEDIGAVSGTIPQITVNWKEKQPLQLQYFIIEMNHEGIGGHSYIYVIAGDELLYTWYADLFYPDRDKSVVIGEHLANQNLCRVKFGNIPLLNKKQDLYGEGVVTLYGTYVNEAGKTVSVQGQQPIRFEYAGTR